MKQTIKGIIGVGAITLFFYILFSILNFAQAIPNDTPTIPSPEPEKKYDLNRLIQQQIPVYCGDTGFIFETSSKLMEESQILVGEVRNGGQPFGNVIGILSFGHSVERNSGTFFMTIPNIGPNGESMTCILGYGLNWKFFDDDGNPVLEGDSL